MEKGKLMDMSYNDIICTICHTKIIVYFHEEYEGNRGKCPNCKTDFPLE